VKEGRKEGRKVKLLYYLIWIEKSSFHAPLRGWKMVSLCVPYFFPNLFLWLVLNATPSPSNECFSIPI